MSFEIYVGNYPTNFSMGDVQKLFSDFDGVKLQKFFQKDKKCFSFLTCQDIDQVISIIEEMNDSIVGGRQLKVRANDQELQDYIDLLRQEGYNDADLSDEDEVASFVPYEVVKAASSNDKRYRDSHQLKKKLSDTVSLYNSSLDDHDSSSTGRSSERDTSRITCRNSTGSNLSDKSSNILKDLSFVSVTNFPFNTGVRTLIKLFGDYDPIRVYMMCNKPTRERAMTEAYVSFRSKDIASDVVLNFDNTIFHGRLLLVNDIEDSSVLDELLVVSHS